MSEQETQLKKFDELGNVYYDDNIEHPILKTHCPECSQELHLFKNTKVRLINDEDGYWRAKFFLAKFTCSSCLKDTQVRVKRYKPQKLHGHYVLDRSDYEVAPGVKIARGRAEDNKFVPDITTMKNYERSGMAFRILRFINNPKRYEEELSWFLVSNNMTYDQMLNFFMSLLEDINKEGESFFNKVPRDIEAFKKELGCSIKDSLEVYGKKIDDYITLMFKEEKA